MKVDLSGLTLAGTLFSQCLFHYCYYVLNLNVSFRSGIVNSYLLLCQFDVSKKLVLVKMFYLLSISLL
jgi:hypothetical protein